MLTTEILKSEPHQQREDSCHGGQGTWFFKNLTEKLSEKLMIQYIHDDILPPGSFFGDHGHTMRGGADELFEEWYLCLSGSGIMLLDGKEVPFEPGDLNVCRNGGSHGIFNRSQEDLRFLVICARGRK